MKIIHLNTILSIYNIFKKKYSIRYTLAHNDILVKNIEIFKVYINWKFIRFFRTSRRCDASNEILRIVFAHYIFL